MMLDKFMISCDGSLYDTSKQNWSELPPLRANFSYHYQNIENTKQLLSCLRAGQYAWPGGYQLFFITSDGDCLSFEAVIDNLESVIWSIRNNVNDGWKVEALDNADECEIPIICDHTGKQLNEVTDYE